MQRDALQKQRNNKNRRSLCYIYTVYIEKEVNSRSSMLEFFCVCFFFHKK